MTLQKGQVLQTRYRIVSLLGKGGMGAVYRAWDVRLNVPIALKEMTPQPGLDVQVLTQLRQQFEQEANILARMKHPHLVRVTDFFEEAGNAYLVMDFVEGESLADCIAREGALDEAQVLVWADQLLGALAYCHGEGVIHRDVKPQNVVITLQGGAVLVDFGLVKLWDPDDPHTRTAMRGMGTPEYAPPEQYDTYVGHTGPQSDIYGVGATLYHALTGQPPPTVTQRIASRSVFKPPRALNPRISRQAEAAILRAMALFVEDRFSTAGEMAAALRGEGQALQGKAPKPKRRPTRRPTKVISGKRAATSSRRRVLVTRVLLSVAALAVLAVCVGSIWSVLAGGGAATAVTPTARATAKPSSTKLPPTLTATPSKTPRPTAAPTATSTRTPKPTSTSLPTLTPIPTSTPVPTLTSTPTPVPTPIPSGPRLTGRVMCGTAPVEGVRVELKPSGSVGYDRDVPALVQAVTGSDGVFIMVNPPVGVYEFDVRSPEGYWDTVVNAQGNVVSAGDERVDAIEIPAGVDVDAGTLYIERQLVLLEPRWALGMDAMPTVDTTTPTLRWMSVPGATQYAISVCRVTGWNSMSCPAAGPYETTDTSVAVDSPLTPGESYRWRVWADDAAGITFADSKDSYFKVVP